MKILVLNGSPKRKKSDTMHITRAFLDGMKEAAPQEVHIVASPGSTLEESISNIALAVSPASVTVESVSIMTI